MTLRAKFIAFALLIHAVLIVLSIPLWSVSKLWFAAVEIIILISVPITIRLYRSFLKPLNLLAAGIESIKDRDFSTTFVETGHQELDQLVGIYNRMISELREERLKQQQQQAFLQNLVDATPLGMIILDLDGKIAMANPAVCAILQLPGDALRGRPPSSFSDGRPGELLQLGTGETRLVNLSGTQIYRCRKSRFTDRGFFREFILIEELTREILSSQKRAYDKVIRMMSHEINNSVGAVNSILQSSTHYARQLQGSDREEFSEALQVAMDRNTGLNRFMKNLADVVRTPSPTRRRQDLHELLRSVQVLTSSLCRERDIAWEWRLAEGSLILPFDREQLEQALLNVVKNAIEAIGTNGTITIETESGSHPKLRIIDTGHGITAEQRPHIFTPFYSSKKDGQGIGLTLVREILANHEYRFNLEALDSERTVFWIEFTPVKS